MRKRFAVIAAAGAMLMALTASPAQAAPSGAAFLASHGIDAAKLAPGWTVQGGSVVWNGGDVIMTPAVYGLSACSSGYVCLYETDNYNTGPYDHDKRMLQYRGLGGDHNVEDYGFEDKMSSWYNRRGYDARWFYDEYYDGTNHGISYCMNTGAKAPKLALKDNDQLSSLYIYGRTTAC